QRSSDRPRSAGCAGPSFGQVAHPIEGGVLLQLIRHLVEPGFDASLVLVAAWSAGSAGRAYGFVADLDRQRAGQGDDVGQMQDIAEYRIGLDALGQRTRWTAQSARRISFAERVFQSVRRRIVAAYLHDNLAVSSDHGRRHCMALGFAGLDRRLRNGYRNGGSEVLVFKKL